MRALKAAEKVRFSKGTGFRVRVRTQSLWKGTASAVPQQDDTDEGFSP